MKGIVKLIPITEPVEGMQVIYHPIHTPFIFEIEKVYDESKRVMINHIIRDMSELSQIVIEYDNYYTKDRLTIIPLHLSDWKEALGKIGQEIEFDVRTVNKDKYSKEVEKAEIIQVAKLIPSPLKSFEQSVLEVVKNALVKGQQFELAGIMRNQIQDIRNKEKALPPVISTQTPIQKAISWCDEQLLKTESPTYQPFLINVKANLVSLLEEEKQFAEDAFREALSLPEGSSHYKIDEDFLSYYKQYEHDERRTTG